MMDLDRRKFLKMLAVTGAASSLPGCERDAHNLVPYFLPDEDAVPGKADWYASVCDECRAGCGILVRVMEGRAKKIEGNPEHPVNQGKLCSRGQAALQGLYNPDRLQQPLLRTGERGKGHFEPIAWEDGLSLWAEALRRHMGAVAMISRPADGTLGGLLARFMEAVRGRLLLYDPADDLPCRAAWHATLDVDRVPFYDLARSDYVLSFGAPFLEHWLSPVALGRAFGEMRQGRRGIRGRFIQVEPRLSLTASSADRWVPVKTGSEGLLALGIGRVLLDDRQDRLPEDRRPAYRASLHALTLEQIVEATDVPLETIVHLARGLARASAPLVIGGGLASAHTAGTDALAAVHSLNILLGNVGRPGGIRLYETAGLGARSRSVPAGERVILRLAESFKQGRYRMLQLYRSNPLFTMPPSAPVRPLVEKPDFIVSFSPYLDESAVMADLILPDHSPLEGWGDVIHADMASGLVAGLRQPAVQPRGDTRMIGDVLLEGLRMIGRASGAGDPVLRAPDFHGLLEARWRQAFSSAPQEAPSAPDPWVRHRQLGGWWEASAESRFPVPLRPPPVATPAFAGDAAEFDLFFCPFPSPSLGRGEGANLPWLQQLPDPLTTAVWGTWVEMHPKTAARHGIVPGMVVRVRSPHGVLEAPAVCVPGLRPDTIAMPMGQGHTAYGRYARDRGVNPLSLLAPLFDRQSGALAACATRVRVEPTGKRGSLVMLEQVQQRADEGLIGVHRKHPGHG